MRYRLLKKAGTRRAVEGLRTWQNMLAFPPSAEVLRAFCGNIFRHSMLHYSDLLPDEQRKLESLDNAIATTLIEAGKKSRAIAAAAKPAPLSRVYYL